MYQNKTFKKILTLATLTLFSVCVQAASPAPAVIETADDASTALDNLQEDLKSLKYVAERIDLGRILVLEKRINNTNKLLKEKGLGTIATLNSYQELVLSFRYSEAFLKAISTQMSEKSVVAIQKKVDAIILARGFDQTMTSQLVAGILSQIHNLTQQIQGQQISDSLIQWMKQDLNQKLGAAKGASLANGDVPSSFQQANIVYQSVAAQYGELNKINSKNPAYHMVTELMGLMEFYREIASRGSYKQGNN